SRSGPYRGWRGTFSRVGLAGQPIAREGVRMAVAPTQEVKAYRQYIGGEWGDAVSGEAFDVINPSNGEVIAQVPKGGREDARRAIAAAREAFDSGVWSDMDPDERVRILRQVIDKLIEHESELAELEALNAGMTIRATQTVIT